MKKLTMVLTGILLWCLLIYGGYWICKHVSYAVFYEDMVKQTIVEMVKLDSLK
jgi:hypothetical protein